MDDIISTWIILPYCLNKISKSYFISVSFLFYLQNQFFKQRANFKDEHACYNLFAHVIRSSPCPHGIFFARRLLEYQEAGQTR
jgi:hypothetical protein